MRTLRLSSFETLSENNSGLKPAVIATGCRFDKSGESGKACSSVDSGLRSLAWSEQTESLTAGIAMSKSLQRPVVS